MVLIAEAGLFEGEITLSLLQGSDLGSIIVLIFCRSSLKQPEKSPTLSYWRGSCGHLMFECKQSKAAKKGEVGLFSFKKVGEKGREEREREEREGRSVDEIIFWAG